MGQRNTFLQDIFLKLHHSARLHPNVAVCKFKMLPYHCFFINGILKIYLIDYAITLVPLFPPLLPSTLHPPPNGIPQSQFMSMGCTYKFFGFYISDTILNLPLFILYLLFMLLSLCTFPPSPLPLPTDNPPCDLHFCDSVPILVICLVCCCCCCCF